MGKLIQLKKQGSKNTAFTELRNFVDSELKKTSEIINKRLVSEVPLINELAGHLVNSGGKRIRPILTIATAKMYNYSGDRHVNLAACIEFLHSATLLHDDVVDKSVLRRGEKTANTIWSNKASVLVGDFLLSKAFEIMVEDKSIEVLRILSKAASVIAEGEVMQTLADRQLDTTEDRYLKIILSKTAELFSAACLVGSIVGGGSTSEKNAMEDFGKNLGIAFQLTDDALDYTASSSAIGKTIGDDFRECKATLPVLLSYRRCDKQDRMFWNKTIVDGTQENGDLEMAIKIMNKTNSIKDTFLRAKHFSDCAKDALAIIPNSIGKELLCNTADFCVERTV